MSNTVRLVTFVPTTHADTMRQAMAEAGAGQIGNYSFCSFSVTGTGRFQPNNAANPAVGNSNVINRVPEALNYETPSNYLFSTPSHF